MLQDQLNDLITTVAGQERVLNERQNKIMEEIKRESDREHKEAAERNIRRE